MDWISEDLAFIANHLVRVRHEWCDVALCDEVIAAFRNPLADIDKFLFHLWHLAGAPSEPEIQVQCERLIDFVESRSKQEVAAWIEFTAA